MNTIKPQLNPQRNKSRHKHKFRFRKFRNFCVSAGFLTLFVCFVSLTLSAEETETEERPSSTDAVEIQTTEDTVEQNGAATEERSSATDAAENQTTGDPVEQNGTAENTETVPETTKEIITGTSKRMESYEQEGITILIDEAKTVRRNEQGIEIGFLNADKITLIRDLETGATKEIVAEGNVEIRDQDIFATCDHAIMNNVTSTIILTDNVVVLQNKDRLETKFFTFNRVTGKQTAEGDVKFKVTVTQAAPVEAEAGEDTESGTDDAGEEQTSSSGTDDAEEEQASSTIPQKTEDPSQSDADAETGNAEGDAEEKSDTDAENAEEADPAEETDTDTGNSDDADSNTETEESGSN